LNPACAAPVMEEVARAFVCAMGAIIGNRLPALVVA
jgi:hypothetical protein